MSRRTIVFVTGSRADYGLLKPVIAKIATDPRALSRIVATGTHLSRRFGSTAHEIELDGFRIDARIPLGIADDSPRGVARLMAKALAGFADAYHQLKPDVVVLLGDRYEILAAAAAALPFRIPVAHIHGGESTEGQIDEHIRHAVTKLSHLHFPAAQAYRDRIISMGERPDRTFCFGSPGLDDLRSFPYLNRAELDRLLGLPPRAVVGAVTYHPVTLIAEATRRESAALMTALAARRDIVWIWTLPNADPGFAPLTQEIRRFAASQPHVRLFSSLGRKAYLSLLRRAAVMAGNSSSGIIEAPSFSLPAVNIGSRQLGRLRCANVIDVANPTPAAIARALARALSPEFKRSLRGRGNLYAGRKAAERIARTLATFPLGPAAVVKTIRG